MAKPTYQEQLETDLKNKRAKLAKARQAGQFRADRNGKVAIEILDDTVSSIVGKAFKDKPLTYEEYLDSHGRVMGLRAFRRELDGTADSEPSLNNEVKVVNDQLKQFQEDQSQ